MTSKEKEISKEKAPSREKVLSALQAQCVKREYCVSDISRKALERCKGDADMAAWIVESLKADKFVDDARYASAFAREKSSLTGWGPIKVRFALRAKGLSDEDISAGLSEVDVDAADARLKKLLSAKWKSLSEDKDGRLKLIKFALSRGYEYSKIEPLVDELTRHG
ncbi:MAG: RecX family transcriptional regulator [Rikenellaceae bacterium]|jgi:regulatory protein|nr:RecX family transcriptional regulator [Rikenellaceae bacterium]